MVTITLYMRQQKRHWCRLCGRRRGSDDLGEWHWNMYNIIYETSRQSSFHAWYRMLGAGALGWPRGMVWGGRREEGSGWGTCVYLWQIHVDIWQNQYNIVKLKIKLKKYIYKIKKPDIIKKKKKRTTNTQLHQLHWHWQLSGKESACQSRWHGFNPWSRKIPHAVEHLSPWATSIDPVL